MKKAFWLTAMLVSVFVLSVGCSNNKEADKEKNESASESAKGEILDFYLSLTTSINSADDDLNTYENAEDPAVLTKEDRDKAAAAADATAKKVAEIKVPDSLKDQKADLEKGLAKLKESYEQKAAELGKDEVNLDAANATLADGEKAIAKAFDSVGLTPPSVAAEVNG